MMRVVIHMQGRFIKIVRYKLIRVIKSRRMRRVGHVAQMGEKRDVYRLLRGKPEGTRPLGSLIHGWVDNIKIDLLEIHDLYHFISFQQIGF
jgi:hypothetical protein